MPDTTRNGKAKALQGIVQGSGLSPGDLIARAEAALAQEEGRLDVLHDGTPKGEMLDPRSFLAAYNAADGEWQRAAVVTRRRVAMIGSNLPCERAWERHRLPDLPASGQGTGRAGGQCIVFFPDHHRIALMKEFGVLPVFYCPFQSSVKCPESGAADVGKGKGRK